MRYVRTSKSQNKFKFVKIIAKYLIKNFVMSSKATFIYVRYNDIK